jgi:hypothetical protein
MRWFNSTGAKTFPLGTTAGSGTSTANRNALVTFVNLTNGSLTASFIPTNPGSTGLPLTESSITLIHQFTEGYWSFVPANSLASTNYNLELSGNGFTSYGQDAEVRIIKRAPAGAWTLNGTHVAMTGFTAKRNALSGFGEFGHATKCDGTNAGPDQVVFNTSTFTMAATLVSGTGLWTIESGSANITNPTSPTTTVTGVPFGTTVNLRWTQTSGACVDFDFVSITNSSSRNTDLPNPDPNIVTAPSGTLVIPMDSLNYNSGLFNIKTYGLIVKLLNAKKGIRWIINSGKVHNGTDFSCNAKKIYPTSGSTAMRNFKGGPFLIYPQDTAGVKAIINAFNAGLTNKVNVYQLTNAASVDERYQLTQRPKVAVLNNGGNGAIHASYMTNAGIQVDSNYVVLSTAENLFEQCYTFASEPHSSAVNAVLDSIRSYVLRGGSFLGECLAVNTYENSSAGHYQTNNGLTIYNITPAQGFQYPNANLSFGQYLGTFDPTSLGGAEQNWALTNSSFINNGYKIQSGAGAADTLIGQSVSKLAPSVGHNVFYTGAHTYAGNSSESEVNGERSYFNALLTPTAQAQCILQNFDADLVVTKTTNPAALCLGSGNITYKIVIVNKGLSANAANNVTLQEVLPAGVNFVSATVSQGSYNSGSGIWNIGTLQLNEKDSITIVVTPTTSGSKVNKAYVNKFQFDFVQSNDTSYVTTYVNAVTSPGSVGSDQVLTSPADPALFTSISPATGVGSITYQWQSGTTGCGGGSWANIPGATAASYDAPGGLTVTTYYRRVATSTIQGSQCTDVSNCVVAFVNVIGPYCDGLNCTANDVQQPNYYLGDINGNPITSIVCTPPDPVAGVYLWLQFQVTATNRYDINVIGDFFVDEVYDHTVNKCLGDYGSGVYNVMLENVSWPCGSELLLANTLFSWENNDDGNVPNSCVVCPGVSSKCARFDTLIVEAPLVADFSYTTACVPGQPFEVYTFTNQTTGGTPPYANYVWNFGAGSTPTPATISGPGATGPFTVTYSSAGTRTITLTVTDGAGVISTRSYIINVQTTPSISISVNDATICDGGTATLTAIVSGGTISVYQWQQLVSSVWTNIGSNQNTYTTPNLTTGTYTYRVIGNPGTPCVSISPNAIITVAADPTVSISSTGLSLCDGGTTTFTATVSGGNGTTNYQWQQFTGSSWTNVGTNSNVYTTPVLTIGTYTYRLLISQDAGCAAQSADQIVTVSADPSVSVSANNPEICVGGSATITATVTGGSGTSTYQWQFSPDNTAWSNVGTNSNIYNTPVINTAGTYYYRVIVTQNPGCSVVSSTQTVVVVSDPTITVQPTNVNECIGGTNTMTVTVTGGSGTITYQWQSSANGSTGWANATGSGATTATYTPPSTVVGTTFYRVLVNATGNGCSQVISANATATITPDISITTQPSNLTECVGGTGTVSVVVTGGSGTITYQWQSSPDGSTGWANATGSGSTASTFTPPSTTAGLTYYRVIISAANSGCDNVTSNNSVVTIVSDPTITSQPTNITECVGGTSTMTVVISGGTGTISYQWQSSPDGTTGWANATGSGSTTSTFTPPGSVPGTTYYRVIINATGNGCGQ